ncbi:MAG: hypothetical protein RIR00_2057 [Pseudomonadota bacterium]
MRRGVRLPAGGLGFPPRGSLVEPPFSALTAGGLSFPWRNSFVGRQCSALTAGSLSFASPKESNQRKGDPRLRGRLRRLPCATRRCGRLRNSGLRPSDSARRLPPPLLRCSALHMGTPKSVSVERLVQQMQDKVAVMAGMFFCCRAALQIVVSDNCSSSPLVSFCLSQPGCDGVWGPHVERRATQGAAEKGRGLFEGRRPEFRSPRRLRVAQGSRQRRPRSLGSPFLWLLSFGEAKESKPAVNAESSASTNQPGQGNPNPPGRKANNPLEPPCVP